MTYPAVQLINRAWNLSGIVARNFETVQGDQGADGLFLLNELLEMAAADTFLIPYWKRYSDVFVVGQEEYYIPNLFDIQTLTFTMDNTVRYPMTAVNRDAYFGNGRVNNIQSLPFQYHYERELDGLRLYVYYLPDQAYTFQLSGKFGLTNVELNTNLSTAYDGFYISYLRYALAKFMCNEYNVEFGADKEAMLMQMVKKMQNISPPDMTLKRVKFINDRTSLNWAALNIGKGWTI